MNDEYYKKALLELREVIQSKKNKLTQDQCRVIAECFNILADKEITKEIWINKIDSKLQENGLDWMDTPGNQAIGKLLVGMYNNREGEKCNE